MIVDNNFIPKRFVEVVSAHVIMNVIDIPSIRTPLILGIHGPMGEGKTEQCRNILKAMSVKPIWLYGDMFESEDAGEPARMIKDQYQEASDFNTDVINKYKQGKLKGVFQRLAVLFIKPLVLV